MIKVPTIEGVIERRILINYQVEKEVIEKFLPSPFKPIIIAGKAIAGICLIRLNHIRPKGFPEWMSIGSENGAHRIAVEWKENGENKEGVFIPRRDTSSKINSLAGGRVFPGRHFHATFTVKEENDHYHIEFISSDNTHLLIQAEKTAIFNPHSIFGNLETASSFFKKGSIGYSPDGDTFDGLKLNAFSWKVEPLQVNQVKSSFFENEAVFPKGSIRFDNALLMTDIKHTWSSIGQICSC